MKQPGKRNAFIAVHAAILLASAHAGSVTGAETAACYDAAIYARAVSQIAAGVPPSCEDCIVIQSPYFVDLKITRVWEGDVRRGRVTVLRMQHSKYRPSYQTWYLRRNTAGGFNALRFGDDGPPPRCAIDAEPPQSCLTPPEGKTLDDLRRETLHRQGSR